MLEDLYISHNSINNKFANTTTLNTQTSMHPLTHIPTQIQIVKGHPNTSSNFINVVDSSDLIKSIKQSTLIPS